MKPRIITIAMLLFIAGCASVPFEKTAYENLTATDSIQAREKFADLLPSKFRVVDSVVFQYGRKSYSAIGYTEIDSSGGMYKVACLNHVGVKLLELKGAGQKIEYGYALEELTDHGDIVQAMAADIRRIYFNRIPGAEAEVCKGKYKIGYREPFNKGVLEHVFAGKGPFLVRKTYFEDKKPIWRVSYYEYTEKNAKIYPRGIVFKHYQYDYRLIVKLKEIR